MVTLIKIMNSYNEINLQSWRDWVLEKVLFDDNTEDINIVLSNEIEKNVLFRCKGYIGFSYLGHWDEGVIESILITNNGEILEQSKKIIANNRSDGFASSNDELRFNGEWLQMDIKLIDGAIVKIAFREIEKEVINKII